MQELHLHVTEEVHQHLPVGDSGRVVPAEEVHVWVRALHIPVYLLQHVVVLSRAQTKVYIVSMRLHVTCGHWAPAGRWCLGKSNPGICQQRADSVGGCSSLLRASWRAKAAAACCRIKGANWRASAITTHLDETYKIETECTLKNSRHLLLVAVLRGWSSPLTSSAQLACASGSGAAAWRHSMVTLPHDRGQQFSWEHGVGGDCGNSTGRQASLWLCTAQLWNTRPQVCPTHFFALLCLAAVAARGPKSIRVDDQILQKTHALKCWGEDSQWVETSSCHFDCSLNAIVNGSFPQTGEHRLAHLAEAGVLGALALERGLPLPLVRWQVAQQQLHAHCSGHYTRSSRWSSGA